MNNLSGYSYFTATAKLIFMGFKFHSEIDNNIEKWINPVTNKKFLIKKSTGKLSKDELLDILKQADIGFEEFINY
ncbi:MAG TPA: addiction module toxin, HicA family [Cyanobacteria bacterium UBA9971]|nr:addiction module toxin, HicA family [Cyanobacteria bacterium UBA9971]